jgi:hypothetical protein
MMRTEQEVRALLRSLASQHAEGLHSINDVDDLTYFGKYLIRKSNIYLLRWLLDLQDPDPGWKLDKIDDIKGGDI